MEEEEIGTVETSEDTGEEEIELDVSEETVDDVETIKSDLAKEKELAKNYKIRAEKAEAKAKETKPEVSNDLSTTDLYALLKAEVNEDDISDVTEYAKLKKISVTDALKTGVVKAILADKNEQRNVASATNTGTTRRAASTASDETLLQRASKGEMPGTDAEMERLIKARIGLK